MLVNMRCFKASVLVVCGALHWVAAEDASLVPQPVDDPSTLAPDAIWLPRPRPPISDLTEVGALCEDTIGLSVPADGSPTIITGSHSKLFSFWDCSYYYQGPVPATVYQIEGTGDMLDVSMFSGSFGSSNEVAVFEGCDGSSNSDNNVNGDGMYYEHYNSNCVAGQYYQGARWQTKAGQLYTIVVYSFYGATDFILRVKTVEASPICVPEGDSSISPIDLGTVNTTAGSLKILGGPEDSVLVTDLPQCDYQTQSSSVLYKITVSQPNVSVSVYAEGDDSYVSVYKGNCESGYSCLAPSNAGYGYPIYDEGTMDQSEELNEEEPVEDVAVDEPEARSGEISMPRYNYNVQSFHNEKAGSTYLVSINSCCGADVSDFRLTVSTTTYGDVCEDSVAADLSSGEFSASINLRDEKVYRELYACYGQAYYEESYDMHSESSYVETTGPVTGPVAFYTITGDGNTYVAYASPSDPNSYFGQMRLALFTATSCDETPQCLQGDGYSSFLSIRTTVGETYYLAVYNEYGESQGSFDLKISAVSSKSPCEDATDLGTVGSAGRLVNGTIGGAGFYGDLTFCNLWAEIALPRVFSFVAEEDGPMMASVKVDQFFHFYPQVTVVTSCGDDGCIAGFSNFEIEMMSPAAVWNAESGVTYYILVISNDLFATGDFQLALEPLETKQVCDSEDVVDLGTIPEEGVMFDGSTVSAPLFSVPASCQEEGGYYSAVTRAATFSLTGDGSTYLLSVSDAYTFSPQVTVFKGSCDNLECLPTSSYSSSFLVDTELNETYTFLIGDCCSTGSGGTFKLHAKKVVAGNVSADATETIGQLGNETKGVMGSTSAGLFYPGLPFCSSSVDSQAAVYKLDTGEGFFSARVSGFGFEAQLSLLKEDDSGGFECYGSQDYRQVSWVGEEGQILYLVVHSSWDMNAVGDFALRFSKTSVSGEPCDDVTDLGNVTEDGLMHIGSSDGWSFLASDSGNETVCEYEGHYLAPGGRSKVFTVVGNGKSLVASAFISQATMNQGIQVSVTVVKGICGSVECLEGAYSEYYTPDSLTWPSTAGETYDIVVSTCCSLDSNDEFVLMVYEEGTRSYGSGYPVYPLEKDQSQEKLSDGTVISVPGNGTNETSSPLETPSSSSTISGMALFTAISMMASVWHY